MLDLFIKAWDARKDSLKKELEDWAVTCREGSPEYPCYSISYEELLVMTLDTLFPEGVEEKMDEWDIPDPKTVKGEHFGDYQGRIFFYFTNKSIYPSKFWALTVSYGSCSGCDTLQSVLGEKDMGEMVRQLHTLCLHMVQAVQEVE